MSFVTLLLHTNLGRSQENGAGTKRTVFSFIPFTPSHGNPTDQPSCDF